MIISHAKQLVWLMTPKAASRSMTAYLKGCLPDAEQHAGPHWSDIPPEAATYAIGAVVRNPYSRVYSVYRFMFPGPNRPPFDMFVKNLARKVPGPMGLSQSEFLRGKAITHLVKFETLADGLKSVPALADCVNAFPHLNATSEAEEWKQAYTQDIADSVYHQSQEDFVAYGYNRHNWKAPPLKQEPTAPKQPLPGVDRVYLLNLKRRPDRLETARAEFKHAGVNFTIATAIDGQEQKLPDGWRDGVGAYGCYLSHIAMLERCIVDGVNSVAVFEDDVVFVDHFRTKFGEFISAVPSNWDAVFLGGQHITPAKPTDNPNVMRATNVHRTHGYIVRGEYIKTLLNHWTTETGHIDHIWGRHQLDPDVNVYCPAVWLCGQGISKSDINGRVNDERFWLPKNVKVERPANKPCGSCGQRRQLKK